MYALLCNEDGGCYDRALIDECYGEYQFSSTIKPDGHNSAIGYTREWGGNAMHDGSDDFREEHRLSTMGAEECFFI